MGELKSGFVALIGRPNVGKSTLMNELVGQKIAITSHKPQTTRNRIQTVYTDERGQIIFLDTPGIHKSKNKLGDYMQSVVNKTLKDVDIILWLVEADEYIGAGEQHILELLSSVLLIIDKYSKLMDFTEIVPVSALKGKNTDELLKVLFKYLPEGPLYYD